MKFGTKNTTNGTQNTTDINHKRLSIAWISKRWPGDKNRCIITLRDESEKLNCAEVTEKALSKLHRQFEGYWVVCFLATNELDKLYQVCFLEHPFLQQASVSIKNSLYVQHFHCFRNGMSCEWNIMWMLYWRFFITALPNDFTFWCIQIITEQIIHFSPYFIVTILQLTEEACFI